ncbi:MAG: MotA/TolQ/ExbB proton channel family protein [Methylotenera sp.]|nr:MotA/TolQ/ExbB proton channel family protein [Oligoflexia bacterium]
MGNFFEFLRTSFWHVMPILVAGTLAVMIILERVRALFKVYPIQNTPAFFEKISDLIMTGKVGEAINHCDKYPAKPAAVVTKQALLRANQPESLIEHGLQLAVGEATQAIQKRTSFLATIANVATLLGLFGTIAGLIQSFEAVGHADAQQKSALLAAGISQAMNATMLGLAVAIPCMVAFSFLMNRTNRLVSEVDQAAIRTLDILKQRYYAAETEAMNPRSYSTDETPEDEQVRGKVRRVS